MVKADIIRSIELKLGLSHEEASAQVEHILNLIKANLAAGEPVLISGFGQWKVRRKKARIGRNPKTKEEYEISPREVVTFYPSNVWRAEIAKDSAKS
ncbi:MAG: integration host factor subunit alpha [Candidatus Lambdaproteobacteria bacterium]|nr:integration host factor subunit alpha [Candidatus Lambdaproteobacteria bacterium]